MSDDPVLTVDGLEKHFKAKGGGTVHAVNGVSFALRAGETIGLVGESGSGKSTIGRCVLRLLDPTGGRIVFDGKDVTHLGERQLRPLRARMQMVFQDPWAALNPRLSIGRLLAEPLYLFSSLDAAGRRHEARRLADRVHLGHGLLERYPSELSGGQLQRVCIARAIATSPKLVVLDEPTSSLDLSVRAGILDLLEELRRDTAVAMLFISHDLGTVRRVSDRLLVLYLGAVVEEGPAAEVFEHPDHPYTQALLSAHLPADPSAVLARHLLAGEIPSPLAMPEGCPFHTRCPIVIETCRSRVPPLQMHGAGRRAACLRIENDEHRLSRPS